MKLNWTLWDKVRDIVKEVGEYQLQKFRTRAPASGTEKTLREMVSEVDINSEKMLIEQLQKLVPEAGFYGEEIGRAHV